MDKIAFGKQLRKYRERIGYSQELLAEDIGCTSIFISYIERGEKSPSLDTLIKMSNVLNVSTDILLGKDVKNICLPKLVELEERIKRLPYYKQQMLLEMFDAILTIQMENYK